MSNLSNDQSSTITGTSNIEESANNNYSEYNSSNSRGAQRQGGSSRGYNNQNKSKFNTNSRNENRNTSNRNEFQHQHNNNNRNSENNKYSSNYNNREDDYDDYAQDNNESRYRHNNDNQNNRNQYSNNNFSRSWQKSRIANRNINYNNDDNHDNKNKNKKNDHKDGKNSDNESTNNDRQRALSTNSSVLSQKKREKLISVSSAGGISCICCLHELFTFVYYSCMHYVCLNCAIKMRVLCEKTDCPVCRKESPQVVCTKKSMENQSFDELVKKSKSLLELNKISNSKPSLSSINMNKPNDKSSQTVSDICFMDISIKDEYDDILENKCDLCPDDDSPQFETFDELNSHMRKAHKRFYCDLCLDHLKLFSFERKYYTREDLAYHKRNGDKNDYSFKGHPLCEYCDQRFFDRDELYKHYRKEHFFCHLCDHDGHEEYYSDYSQLREHFLKAHYLCELDDCSKNAAQTHEYVVFRSELDFQAHKKQKHAKSKTDSKNFAKLNIEFNVTREHDRERVSGTRFNNRRGGGHGRSNKNQASANVDSMDEDDFNEVQSKLKNSVEEPVDPKILKISREQFEKEEEERKRQLNLQRMKDQHEKFEQANSSKITSKLEHDKIEEPAIGSSVFSSIANSILNSTSTSTSNQPQQSSWRDLIGSGNAPKINAETEFPSLGGNESKKSILSSSSIINSTGNKQLVNPWQSPAKVIDEKSKKTKHLTNSSDSKNDAEFLIKPKLELKETETKKNKKKNKKNPQKGIDTDLLQEKHLKSSEDITKDNDNLEESTKNLSLMPPPGFSNNKTLDLAKSTPPGFESKLTNHETSQKRETTDEVKLKENEYIKPENYDSRNQELTNKLFLLFGHYNEKEFQKFKTTSIEFRQTDMKASEYLQSCQKLLDLPLSPEAYSTKKNLENKNLHLKFLDLVQEMIVLLPDIKKQQDLYQAYSEIIEKFNFSNDSTASGLNWAAKTKTSGSKPYDGSTYVFINKLLKCNICNQFFFNSEINFHQSSQHIKQLGIQSSSINSMKIQSPLNDDFPSLASSGAATSTLVKEEKPKMSYTSTLKSDDFPSLSPDDSRQKNSISKKNEVITMESDFPALSTLSISTENRFSALPTASIFANPNSHLSLVKKKHRLQK